MRSLLAPKNSVLALSIVKKWHQPIRTGAKRKPSPQHQYSVGIPYLIKTVDSHDD